MIGSGSELTVFLWKVESSEILLVEAFGRITTLLKMLFLHHIPLRNYLDFYVGYKVSGCLSALSR